MHNSIHLFLDIRPSVIFQNQPYNYIFSIDNIKNIKTLTSYRSWFIGMFFKSFYNPPVGIMGIRRQVALHHSQSIMEVLHD